jgi:hypothetical protein
MNRERVDPEGYIVSEADLGNVQPDFEQVPKTAAVGKSFPEWAEAARRAGEQGRQPVADARVVAELLETFGRWVERALDRVMRGS